MEEQEEKAIPASSDVDESCREGVSGDVVCSVSEERIVAEPVSEDRDVGLGKVAGSLSKLREEVKVADSAGKALSLEAGGKSEARRPLDSGNVTKPSKEVAESEADGFGDVVGGGSGGSSVPETVSTVKKQSLELEVVEDETETPGPQEVVPQDQSVESSAEERLSFVGSSGGETVPAVTEKDTKCEALGPDGTERKQSDDALKVVASSRKTHLLFDENEGNKHTSTAVKGNTASMNDEDMRCPNIEGMDADAYNEKFCFSLEELQATSETANGITENQHNTRADRFLPCQPAQVAFQHEVSLSINMRQNSEAGLGIAMEQSLHKNMTRKATDGDQAGKIEVANESVKKSSNSNLGFATSHQFGGVGDEIAAVNFKVSDNAKSTYIGLRKYIFENNVVHGEEADPQLEADQSFDKNAVHGPVQLESEQVRRIITQGQVACSEQVLSEDNHASETLEVDAVCLSSDLTRAIDRGHTPLGNMKFSTLGLQKTPGGDNEMKIDEEFKNSEVEDIPETGSGMEQKLIFDDQTDDAEYDDSGEGSEMEVDEQDSERDYHSDFDEKPGIRSAVKSGTFAKGNQASFLLQTDDTGGFCVSDLVWGKVRSHPWWPGQIFDPSDASERAIKYHKKDCFLVAYFGDRTFAWNEASLLKPFTSHFSHVEKQSNSDAFQNAVSCALDEVSRRVQLGLSCPCIPAEDLERIKYQIVENTGVRPESSTRECGDSSVSVNLFSPEKLVAYMKTLAQYPADGTDRLDLVIVKSQLLAFYRSKGYSELPAFQSFENEDGLQYGDDMTVQVSVANSDDWETSCGQENSSIQGSSYHKRKHNLKEGGYLKKREKFMSESLSESWDTFDEAIDLDSPSGKRRKGYASFADDLTEGRKTMSLAKVSTIPKPSFKIGECIRRIASQMTGSPSISKSTSQKPDESIDRVRDGSGGSFPHSEDSDMKAVSHATVHSSQQDMLAQLFSAAEHPIGSYGVSNVTISFFSEFRNSVVINPDDKDGRSRELAYMGGSPGMFEFEDMSDTYWTDRVIQNGSEEQLPRRGRKRQNQLVPVDADKRYRRSNSRKQHLEGNVDIAEDKPLGYVDEDAPAELVMHFPIADSVPSETNLNRMFRRFGPLKESDTEVDRDTNRARVVFKKCRDAEAAYGSASKFNIFGQMLVNYHLNYSISVPFKTPTIVTSQVEDDTTLFLEY